MLELKSVKKIYTIGVNKKIVALNDISCTLNSAGMHFVLGKSGCGKTSLLNVIGCLDSIDSGEIILDGLVLSNATEKQLDDFRNNYFGFIFQEYNLIESYSVKKNIEISLELQGKNNTDLVKQVLDRVGLVGYEDRKINELSGGQKQRVAIARALIKNPRVILADEPTGNLDSVTSSEIFDLLKELSKETCVIVVSHDIESAKKYADRIINMVDGRIVDDNKINDSILSNDFKLINQENNNKKARLKITSIFKMAASGIKKRLGRYIATILLLTIAIGSIGFALSDIYNDEEEIFLSACQKYNQRSVAITTYDVNELNEGDVEYINSVCKTNSFIDIYKINQLFVPYGEEETNDATLLAANPYVYYAEIESEDCKKFGFNILAGELPSNNSEVAITKLQFEIFKRIGLVDEKTDKTVYFEKLNDVLNYSIYGAKIVGIVDTNANPYAVDNFFKEYDKNRYGEYTSQLFGAYYFEVNGTIHGSLLVAEGVGASAFIDEIQIAGYTSSSRLEYNKYSVGDYKSYEFNTENGIYLNESKLDFEANVIDVIAPIELLRNIVRYGYDWTLETSLSLSLLEDGRYDDLNNWFQSNTLDCMYLTWVTSASLRKTFSINIVGFQTFDDVTIIINKDLLDQQGNDIKILSKM